MPFDQWGPYVPVAKRRSYAKKQMEKLRKKGLNVQPVEIEGRSIAKSFWGKTFLGKTFFGNLFLGSDIR